MKKSAITALVLDVICFIFGFFCEYFEEISESEGLVSKVIFDSGLSLTLKMFGFVTLFCSVIVMLFNEHISKCCTVVSFSMALATAFFAGVGLQCVLMILSSRLISDPARTPISDFVGGLGILICMLFGISMIIIYSFYRNKHPSGIGIFIDVIFGLLYIVPFQFAFAVFYSSMESIVRYFYPNF